MRPNVGTFPQTSQCLAIDRNLPKNDSWSFREASKYSKRAVAPPASRGLRVSALRLACACSGQHTEPKREGPPSKACTTDRGSLIQSKWCGFSSLGSLTASSFCKGELPS